MRKVLFFCSVLLLATPNCFSLYSKPSNFQGNVYVMKYLKSLKVKEDIYLLNFPGACTTYLNDNFHCIGGYTKPYDKGFKEFFKEKQVNMIFVTGYLFNDIRYKKDVEWFYFFSNYKKLGFERVDLPGYPLFFLVKKGVIDKS